MRIDYIKLLLDKGFKLPICESSFDNTTFTQTNDERRKNLIAILNCALNGFLIEKSNNTDIELKNTTGERYSLSVSENAVICRLCDKNEGFVCGSREFSLTLDNEGNYLFRRMLIETTGILIVDYKVAQPTNFINDAMVVTGYDADTFALLKKEVTPNDKTYEESINAFLTAFEILPDMHREIRLAGQTYNKKIIHEIDKLANNIPIEYTSMLSYHGNIPVFIFLENFLRQKNYDEELSKLKGLPIILTISPKENNKLV